MASQSVKVCPSTLVRVSAIHCPWLYAGTPMLTIGWAGTIELGAVIAVDDERASTPVEVLVRDQAELWIRREPFRAGALLAPVRPPVEAVPVVENQHRSIDENVGEKVEDRHRRRVEIAVDPRYCRSVDRHGSPVGAAERVLVHPFDDGHAPRIDTLPAEALLEESAGGAKLSAPERATRIVRPDLGQAGEGVEGVKAHLGEAVSIRRIPRLDKASTFVHAELEVVAPHAI